MKKFGAFILSFTLMLTLTHTALANEWRTLTLKDGSILKGKVLQMANNVYTIETENLGTIKIAESDVLSISTQTNAQKNPTASSAQLQNQVQKLQGDLLNDPNIMNEIETMLESPEVMNIMQDPDFIKDVMSFDEEKIQNNPKTMQLMNNPQMKALMQQIQQKIE